MKRVLIGGLLLLIAAAAVAKIFVFEIPMVGGDDMAPTLLRGDRLLANRLLTPRRGDLVLIEHPQGSRLLLRRVIGLPGERVAVRAETPEVNRVSAKRQRKETVTLHPLGEAARKMVLVQETIGKSSYLVLKDPHRRSVDAKPLELRGAYYVMSDNRNHGTDSRTFGAVAKEKIHAVITHRLSPGPGSLEPLPPRTGFASLRQE